jgi:hypothetical protein
MPVTRAVFFTAGVAVGALARAAYPRYKDRLDPVLSAAMAGAGRGLSEAYQEVSRLMAEHTGNIQEAGAAQSTTAG